MTPSPDQSFVIPESELTYQASRSGGPGGQHVNTSSTRVEVRWDIAGSPSLDPMQRERLLARLATRLDKDGIIRLVSSGSRSQAQNRREVTERLHRLVNQALVVPKRRKATRPTVASRERRLAEKRARSARKAERRKRPEDL